MNAFAVIQDHRITDFCSSGTGGFRDLGRQVVSRAKSGDVVSWVSEERCELS